MVYNVHTLYAGYSRTYDEDIMANCSCTLIRGRRNIIVDTMTPWDKERIIQGLARYNLTPDDIRIVVCTHGHSDHIGNNNLFLNAKHIVGYSVSYRDMYNLHPFEDGEPYIIDDDVRIIPTPGHTNADVSVIVRTADLGTVAVVGDLFEREEDLTDPHLWRVIGGSENPKSQEKHRSEILLLADHIIPGHGPMFAVTPAMRMLADEKLNSLAAGGPSSGSVNAHRSRHQNDRDWKNSSSENTDRPSHNQGHRPSVWEGRLGPSNDWEAKQREPAPRSGGRSDRAGSARDADAPRSWVERDKEREPWSDRRRSSNEFTPAPVPLLDDETLKRIEHKRGRLSGPWDGRQSREDLASTERPWTDRAGFDGRPPPPTTERFRGERRDADGHWDERHSERPARESNRMESSDRVAREERPSRDGRFGRNDRLDELPAHEERLRRDDRIERNERSARDDRPIREDRSAREERPSRNFAHPAENKSDRDSGIQSNRFGGGKLRTDRPERTRRDSRGRGRDDRPPKNGSPEAVREIKDAGSRAPRRDEAFRREGREARRPGDERRPGDDRRLTDERRLTEDRRVGDDRRVNDDRRLADDRRLGDDRRLTDERRVGDDRSTRLKDERPRRETRPREGDDFQERNIRPKHYDEGRNGANGRTMRFHP